MSDVKKYPFNEYAWDDDPSNDNTWVDGKEAKSAYDALQTRVEELEAALLEIKKYCNNTREAIFKQTITCIDGISNQALKDGGRKGEG